MASELFEAVVDGLAEIGGAVVDALTPLSGEADNLINMGDSQYLHLASETSLVNVASDHVRLEWNPAVVNVAADTVVDLAAQVTLQSVIQDSASLLNSLGKDPKVLKKPVFDILKKDGKRLIRFESQHDFTKGALGEACGKTEYRILSSADDLSVGVVREGDHYYILLDQHVQLEGLSGQFDIKLNKRKYLLIEKQEE